MKTTILYVLFWLALLIAGCAIALTLAVNFGIFAPLEAAEPWQGIQGVGDTCYPCPRVSYV